MVLTLPQALKCEDIERRTVFFFSQAFFYKEVKLLELVEQWLISFVLLKLCHQLF